MNEIQYNGDIFKLPKTHDDACVVTTNGIVRQNKRAVMGAGIAKYCRDNFNGVDKHLGEHLLKEGNHVYSLGWWGYLELQEKYYKITNGDHCRHKTEEPMFHLISFPTKDDWKDSSKPELIRQSCQEAMELADKLRLENIYMPCPGCSNGRLNYWTDVRPILMKELDDRFIVCIPNHIMSRLNNGG